jgi:hypothetical protein
MRFVVRVITLRRKEPYGNINGKRESRGAFPSAEFNPKETTP